MIDSRGRNEKDAPPKDYRCGKRQPEIQVGSDEEKV